ncbi:MAG: sulfatase, partial [Chthoniobacterales bacterium]
LADWRRSVGAQECRPNPDFNAAAHRALYVDRDPSRIPAAPPDAAAIEADWKPWRAAMDAAVRGHKVVVTPAAGDVRLLAKDAQVHGEKLRYEPAPYKNTLGFWTRPEDWASWDCELPRAGRYEVEVQQGCGKGSGGAEVEVSVGDAKLRFTVEETGHFQQFIARTIGVLDLPAGKVTVAVKPQSKPGAAVMDLRRIVLRPVP